MSAFDPARALATIAAWPDGLVHPRLIEFLHKHGITDDRIAITNIRHVACAYNRAVRDIALPSRFDWFLFADRDLIPGPNTDPWFDVAGEIVCCQYPLRNEAGWGHPQAFHTGLWRCRREVLEALPPPWFLREFSPDGCELRRCVCEHFRNKALAAGFAIARAGWADHKVRS